MERLVIQYYRPPDWVFWQNLMNTPITEVKTERTTRNWTRTENDNNGEVINILPHKNKSLILPFVLSSVVDQNII